MQLSLKLRNKYWAETNPVVMAVVIGIMITILSIGSYNILTGYFSHQEAKAKAMAWEVVDNIVLNAQTWEGIMTDDRNKRNIYLLKDGSNVIEVYSYKEIFEEKLTAGAVRKIATPVIKFDRYYTFNLPMGMLISFEWTDLKTLWKTEVALQVDAPHWEVTLFDVDGNFLKFTEADKLLPQSADERTGLSKQQFDGKTYIKDYWRGDVANDVQYGRIVAGCTPPSCTQYEKMDIGIQYKRDIIWSIKINKETNKIAFSPKGLEVENYVREPSGSCENFYKWVCYTDNTYYLGRPDSDVNECTFFGWDCHKNDTIMTKPDGTSCRWAPGVCTPI